MFYIHIYIDSMMYKQDAVNKFIQSPFNVLLSHIIGYRWYILVLCTSTKPVGAKIQNYNCGF